MFAFFHSLGNDSVSRQFLKIRCNGFDTEEAQSFIMHIEISSWPWVLFWSNDLIFLTISSTQNSKDESLSLVSKFILTGTVLSLDIGVHCLAKKLFPSDYSPSHSFPSEHNPSHSFYLPKSITFRFTIFCYTHYIIIQPYCHFLFLANNLGLPLDEIWFYKINHHLKLNSCVLLYSLPHVS